MTHLTAGLQAANRMRAAQVAYDNLLPEDFERPEPPEPDYDSYVDDWLRGNLAEPPGKDIYYEPLERLTEDSWLCDLLAARTDEEILEKARIVRDKLREFICAQLDEQA